MYKSYSSFKKIQRSILFTAVFTLVFTSTIYSQDKVDQIDSMMHYAADNKYFNGIIMVSEKGKVIYNKGFGYADMETKEPITEYSIFNLCSIAKQFTAMCIMILKEDGKLSYDDKLVKYFPQLPYNDVTIRQMLHHTSGLPDYFRLLFDKWTIAKIPVNNDAIELLATEKPLLKFVPGEKHEYSNTGYMLLASIIEKISGISFETYLNKNIFEKAGMKNTCVYFPGISATVPKGLAKPYAFDNSQNKFVLTSLFDQYSQQVTRFDGTYGDGGIYSCSHDMVIWDEVLKTEKLVKRSTLAEAFTNGVLNDGQPITPVGYGFGWFIVNDPVNGKILQHTGGWPGFRQAIIRYLDKDRTLLVLRNNEIPFSGIQKAVENILDGKPFDMPQPGMAFALANVSFNGGTASDIRSKFESLKNNSIKNEDELNSAGYAVMAQGKYQQALEIMRINAELFPGSWNAFDSLGELFLKNGNKELAKLNYEKSLKLNPQNEGAKKVLESL